MPEGDSIARLAARLRAALVGRTVTSSAFAVAGIATSDLTGRTLVEVGSYGKHLLARFDGTPPVTLHVHLRMDGSVRVQRLGRGAPRISHDIRFVVVFADVVAVGERVPVVELVETAREHDVVGHLGPDLLAPDWGPPAAAEAVRRLGTTPDRPVIEALLDQRNLAGVGNLYAVEGCFIAGLYPWRPVASLLDRLPAVVDLEHRMLVQGVRSGVQVTTGDRRNGRTHWVYGRKDQPCRRCGATVRFDPGDGGPGTRATWWCPHCQPARWVGAEGVEPSRREAAGFKPAVSAVPPRARWGRA